MIISELLFRNNLLLLLFFIILQIAILGQRDHNIYIILFYGVRVQLTRFRLIVGVVKFSTIGVLDRLLVVQINLLSPPWENLSCRRATYTTE